MTILRAALVVVALIATASLPVTSAGPDAAERCEWTVTEGGSFVAHCHAAQYETIVLVGDRERVECHQSSDTLIVVVGSHNQVTCQGGPTGGALIA